MYIDDYNTIEKVPIKNAPTHITTKKQQVNVVAIKSGLQYSRVEEMAKRIGMVVNENKTQVLCIHSSKFSEVKSYIRTKNGRIESTDNLKILGFRFNTAPNATYHVNGVIKSMYNKLWTLRYLKKSGMDQSGLLNIYKMIVRSAAEYCSVVYHSLIPKYLADGLERAQKQAMKIVFGRGMDYARILEDGVLETLEERREKSCLRFAMKARSSARFGNKWFPVNNVERVARHGTRRIYKEKRYRTDRDRNNPMQYMLRLLNEHENETNEQS